MRNDTRRRLALPVRFATALSFLSGLTLLGLLVLTIANIVGRRWLGTSVPGAIEYTEVTLTAIVFLGLARAEYEGAHVRTALLTSKLAPTPARVIRLVGLGVSAAFLLIMSWALADRAQSAFLIREFRIGVAEVQVWPFRIIAVLGVLALAIALIDRLGTHFRSHAESDDGEALRSESKHVESGGLL